MDFEPAYNRFSLAQMGQRTAASGIDIVVCLMLSSLLEALVGIDVVSSGGELIFCFVWLFGRVLVPTRTQGQSIGRWAMNLRVVDVEFGKTANVIALARREATILIAMLIWIASLDSLTGAVILALVPVVVDIAPAFVDIDRRQALHDRIGGTIVINSRKGFELERKLLGFFGQANKFVKTSQRTLQDRYGADDDRQGYAGYQDAYADPYARGRQRYGDPYANRRRTRATRASYNAPESYGQAYREPTEPVDRYGDYADDGYGDPEPWGDYDDYSQSQGIDDLDRNYGDPRADRYGDQNPQRSSRPRPDSSRRRDSSDRSERQNDWGDWDYDERYDARNPDPYNDPYNDPYDDQPDAENPDYDDRSSQYDPYDQGDRRDPRGNQNRYSQSDQADYGAPRRRSTRNNKSNPRRSPRRPHDFY
ncbi:RDD domain containing protein [Thalassoporum mexicanum PCC 7367]|uniref:RDD family protein n=1 Tax=Thalassoporum mexicanum TaxID=3457544 RepID=UPI00029FE02B|nr:RDD family protein [Pseudanabaena sp. PCC 7367]AFY70525.1 RDD domain containing protein [Pseudanabaena sp. PCC 7367]